MQEKFSTFIKIDHRAYIFKNMLFKKTFTIVVLLLSLNTIAQTTTLQTNKLLEQEQPILLGGGIVLGGSNSSFQFGINPELLKSYNSYIDLGIAMNIYYASYNPTQWSDYRSRNFQYGIGTFVRAWPIESFFVQLQPEYNWTFASEKNTVTGVSGKANFGAASLLAGIGYGRHSAQGMNYFSVMIDLLNSSQSPYRMGQLKTQPIFRAGIGFPIRFPKKKQP